MKWKKPGSPPRTQGSGQVIPEPTQQKNCTGKNKNRLKIQSAQDQRWTAVTSGTYTASPLRVHASLREKPQTAHGWCRSWAARTRGDRPNHRREQKIKKKLYIFIINPKDPQYIKHWCHENIYTLQHGDCPPPNSVCKCAGTHVYKEHTGEPPLIKTTKSLFTFMQFILKEKKKNIRISYG